MKPVGPVAATAPSRLLFVVNNPAFFISHRLPIALEAQRRGYVVEVATPGGEGLAAIGAAGFAWHIIPLKRGALRPLADAAATLSLVRLFRRLRPDIVHAVTLKPIVFAGIAARLVHVPAFVAAIAGLGYAFVDRGNLSSPLRRLIAFLCRIALRHPNLRVIFQNDADRGVLVATRAVDPSNACMIRGSGVDLQEFAPVPEPSGVPLVILSGRMLRDKGVAEFVRAAALVKADLPETRFVLVGDVDPGNPTSCTAAELRAYEAQGSVEWWGFRPDMAAVMSAAHIVVLPSYYGEGLPKVLMEAAAAGRAVVTTDVPGCRSAIIPGLTGFAVSPRDAGELASAIAKLLADAALRQAMGKAGRLRAELEFGVERVVEAHMQLYVDLLKANRVTKSK